MMDKYCFTIQVDRKIIEEKNESEILKFFQTDGAEALMQLYTMAKAAMNPPVKAQCHANVGYDFDTGDWSFSIDCNRDGGEAG
jgi:hypothetical protein